MSFSDAIKALKRMFGGGGSPSSGKKQDDAQRVGQGEFSATEVKYSVQDSKISTEDKNVEQKIFVKKFGNLPERPKEVAPQSKKTSRTPEKKTPSLSHRPQTVSVTSPPPRPKPKKQVILGLDFGTAFTKAIIREQRVCYAVPFNAPGLKNRYLLPGDMQIDSDEKCRFCWEDGCFAVSDMKMKLLERLDSREDRVYASVFLGLIMRHCRNWLMTEHKSSYEGFELDWYVNIGLPTESYHDEELKDKYHHIALTGWALSLDDGDIALSQAEKVSNDIEGILCQSIGDVTVYKNGMLSIDSIGLFPEFVAQIVGYVRSPLRKSDLHILMDVGAGTLDLAIFNVHKNNDGEDVFPIFAKDIKPLGTQFMCRHRINSVKATQIKVVGSQKVPSKSEFAKLLDVPYERLAEIDKPFERNVREQLNKQITYTRNERYVRSPAWKNGVPLFLCGGGGQVDFYADIIRDIDNKTTGTSKNIATEILPKPSNLKAPGLATNDYHRLSVAYGLSFDAFDIGQVIMANEIDDDEYDPTPVSPGGIYVGKEMV